MALVTTTYLSYNHNGGGVRHHHFTSANDITATIYDDYSGTTDSNPGSHTANGWPSLPFQGANLPFAFMSVHNAADGNHLYTASGNQTFPVGSSDVDILVVYAPVGGIGSGGGPGIWVDAFNVDTGNFSDDLHFITILTPPTPPDTIDNSKTTFANQEGEVSSVTPEHLRASITVDGGVPFVEWKKVVPTESISNSTDFDLRANETGEIWFAFYQSFNLVLPKRNSGYEQVTHIYFGVINDAPGLTDHGPVGPWDPFVRQLAAGVALAVAAGKVNDKLKGELLNVAARQVSLSAEAIVQSIKSIGI